MTEKRIKNKNLKYYTLIVAVVLLIVLSLLSIFDETSQMNLDEINERQAGEKITVTGTSENIRYSGDHLFFDLVKGNSSIRSVLFNAKNISIKRGQVITVKGKIQMYKNEPEIIVYKIYN